MHLGYVLTSNNISKASIDMSCANFCVAVNSVLSLFPKAHSNVKYYLFNQFCMSLYGCVLWDLSSNYTLRHFLCKMEKGDQATNENTIYYTLQISALTV